MHIADDTGKVYKVNHPDQLLASADNDDLLAVLRATYVAKCLMSDIQTLLANGYIVEEADNEDDEETIIEGLNEGVDFLSAHLSSEMTTDKVEGVIDEAKEYMKQRVANGF